MLPDTVFLYLDLYTWAILVGVIAAMVLFRVFYRKAGLSDKVFTFSLLTAVPCIVLGYLSAVLVQSWYSYLETGVFEWGVGATFYGGLIGAIAVFLCGYFGIGHFVFKDRAHVAQFMRVLSLGVACIACAHACGRIGCLFAGCCYGRLTDSFIGIPMRIDGVWERRVPIQLFEAIFLFALSAFLFFLTVKKSGYTASAYLILYGVWRFFIEYARDDDRGSSGISFLSPSQLTSLLLILMGVLLILLYVFVLKKVFQRAERHEEA